MILCIDLNGESDFGGVSGTSKGRLPAVSKGGTGSFSGPIHTARCIFEPGAASLSATFSKRNSRTIHAPRIAACYD
jgi:hypothetical protein